MFRPSSTQSNAPANDVPIVLRMSGGTSILTELSNEGLTVAIEDAIRLNAAAITLSVFVGEEGERVLALVQSIEAGNDSPKDAISETEIRDALKSR